MSELDDLDNSFNPNKFPLTMYVGDYLQLRLDNGVNFRFLFHKHQTFFNSKALMDHIVQNPDYFEGDPMMINMWLILVKEEAL